MNMKKAMLFLLIVAMLFVMTGCGDRDKIVGKWTGSPAGISTQIEFRKDGIMTVSIYMYDTSSLYRIEGDYLVVLQNFSGAKEEKFAYTLKGDILTINGDIFTRVK